LRRSKLCIIEPGATGLHAVANTRPRWKSDGLTKEWQHSVTINVSLIKHVMFHKTIMHLNI
jgi:hypothetical protein